MSACCNNGFKMIHEVMDFKMWLGLIGPAGPAGSPGRDVQLRGPVATVYDLPVTAPASELWQVGTQAPYNGYFFNGTSWVNLGPVAAGATFTPSVSADGTLSWTNDGGLPNPQSVNIKGPAGPAGPDGTDGSNGATFTPSVSADGQRGRTAQTAATARRSRRRSAPTALLAGQTTAVCRIRRASTSRARRARPANPAPPAPPAPASRPEERPARCSPKPAPRTTPPAGKIRAAAT